MKKLKNFVDHPVFTNFILVIILFNSLLLGLATDEGIMASSAGSIINLLDDICLGIFIGELILKLIAYNKDFFKSQWNLFDLVIILICLIPNMQTLSVLRTFRVLRVLRSLRSLRALRMISGFKHLRIIVSSILDSIPGVLWTGLLLLIDFYIFAILGTTMFGHAFPDWFGDLGDSFYTLFQVMTLESWSMGISRPVMEVFPWAWAYFVPFVISSAFIVMNVVVGIVVNTISETSERMTAEDKKAFDAKFKKGESETDAQQEPSTKELLQQELSSLKEQIERIEKLMEKAD